MRISDWSSDVWSSDLGVCVCVCQTWLLTLLRSSCRSREANAHKMPYTTVSSCVITSEKLVPMSCSIARKLGAEQTAKQSQPMSDTHAHKQIGRASSRESMWKTVEVSGVAGKLK